jgi:hypothetical protein
MRHLTRDEFLRAAGVSSDYFDLMQRKGHVALAFGAPMSAAGRYFPLDLVAIAIASEQTPPWGRQTATDLVLMFHDKWLAAVARAEAEAGADFFFAVGALGPPNEPRQFWVTSGTWPEIAAAYLDPMLRGVRIVSTNVTAVLARVRASAAAAGVDLSDPFWFAPDDERHLAAVREGEDIRRMRLAYLRARKPKGWAKQQARMRRKDMQAVG